ncbi:MAG: HEAT repeat domain-containing protein [Planctomycetes bacterium]|nr:HEAT repeat domain-containing protein [Planctomycetota bacterium]
METTQPEPGVPESSVPVEDEVGPPMPTEPPAGPPWTPPEPPPEARRPMMVVAQFFLVPFLLAAIGTGIVLGVRLLTSDSTDAFGLIRQIRITQGTARWQNAFALYDKLTGDPAARKDPRLVAELIGAYKGIDGKTDEDFQTRVFLLSLLGLLRDPRGLEVIQPAMDDPNGVVAVTAIQAAGTIGDASVADDLLRLAKSEDAGIRKTAVFSLGLLNPRRAAADGLPPTAPDKTREIQEALRTVHRGDPIDDVRWNAALALTRFGDPEAAPTIRLLLDRTHLNEVETRNRLAMPEEQKSEVLINAMMGARELNDPSFRPLVERLAGHDPSSDVRRAAGEWLELVQR